MTDIHIMNIKDKHILINIYQKGAYSLRGLISTVPLDAIDTRAGDPAWSIREHVSHLQDSELFAFLQYRKAIAEPGSLVERFDEELWRRFLDYTQLDVQSMLMMIETVRTMTSSHLMTITGDDWQQYYTNSNDTGPCTLIDVMSHCIEHINDHMESIQQNVDLFIQ